MRDRDCKQEKERGMERGKGRRPEEKRIRDRNCKRERERRRRRMEDGDKRGRNKKGC